MNEVILSIVIPVYNVEKYLNACIGSIINQKIDKDKIEIILVDDGANDTSGIICDNSIIDRISVVHQKNGGLAAARNSGLAVASGRFVSFIDSDDLVYGDCLNDIVKKIANNDADLTFMKAEKFYESGEVVDLGDEIYGIGVNNKSKSEVLNYLSSRPKFPGSACTKIYKRNYLLKNDFHFPKDKRQSEDLGFVRDCILTAESYYAIDDMFYRYRQCRAGSITNTMSPKAVDGPMKFVIESVRKLTHDCNPNDNNAALFLPLVTYEYCIVMFNLSHLPDSDFSRRYGYIKEYRWLLKYGKSLKTRIVYWISGLFGFRFTLYLLKYKK